MKSIKRLGLAALAALMTLAFAGAPAAVAETTALCGADEGSCASEETVTHLHATTLNGKKSILSNSISKVECDVLFLGETVEQLSAPLEINGTFTYSNCSGSCSIVEEEGPGLIEVLRVKTEEAEMNGVAVMHVKCLFLNCVYNAEQPEEAKEPGVSTVAGALASSEENGEVATKMELTHVSGALCPKTSSLDIVVTPLSPTYIAS